MQIEIDGIKLKAGHMLYLVQPDVKEPQMTRGEKKALANSIVELVVDRLEKQNLLPSATQESAESKVTLPNKWWYAVVMLAATVFGLFGGAKWLVSSLIQDDLKPIQTELVALRRDIGKLSDAVEGVEKTLASIDNRVNRLEAPYFEKRLKDGLPADPAAKKAAAEELAAWLDRSTKQKMPIPVELVKDYGMRMVAEIERGEQSAILPAVAAAEYYSSQFKFDPSWVELTVPEELVPEWLKRHTSTYRKPGQPPVRFFGKGKVPLDRAYVLWPLGAPDPRIGAMKTDYEYFGAQDGIFRIDKRVFKNVIFVNSEIVYSGMPFVLENVMFINCRFRFEAGAAPSRLLRYVFSQPLKLPISNG